MMPTAGTARRGVAERRIRAALVGIVGECTGAPRLVRERLPWAWTTSRRRAPSGLRASVAHVVAVTADTLSVRLLDPRARPPARTREGDAGYDLRCLEGFRLAPGERAMVGTGVAIALPPDVAGLVTPRSGLAARHGIALVNSPGLVDPNYRGELRVVLVNLGGAPFEAQAGDRIAQLLLVPFWAPDVELVAELPPSDRGPDGFGSSGSA
jgi:dUTP pyrophosphatase